MLCMQNIQPRAYYLTVSFSSWGKETVTTFEPKMRQRKGRGKQGGTKGKRQAGDEGITSCMRVTLGQPGMDIRQTRIDGHSIYTFYVYHYCHFM